MQQAARQTRPLDCLTTTMLLIVAFGNNCRAEDERISGATLKLVDSVQVTLARNPAVLNSGLQVDIAQGQLKQSQGPFDTVLSTSINSQRKHTVNTASEQLTTGDSSVNSVVSDETVGSIKLSQLLRNGVTIEPAIAIFRTTDNSAASQLIPVANRATVGVNVTVPLLRNPGADISAVGEHIAQLELEAVRLDRTRHCLKRH